MVYVLMWDDYGWNISTMVAQGKTTWPHNTTKCYYDYSDGGTDPVVDMNGACFNPSDYESMGKCMGVGILSIAISVPAGLLIKD